MIKKQEQDDFSTSVRILLSLYVMIRQNYDALIYYERYLSEESDEKIIEFNPPKADHEIDEAIVESLWFQIILKSSSFLDEWDKFLGIHLEQKENPKIQIIKSAVSPARKAISKWKDLKRFRNEIIAHNLRNKEKEFTLDNMANYNCPQSYLELSYLIQYLNRMIRVLTYNFPEHANSTIDAAKEALNSPHSEVSEGKEEELAKSLSEVDERIADRIWDIPRYNLIDSITKNLNNGNKG